MSFIFMINVHFDFYFRCKNNNFAVCFKNVISKKVLCLLLKI